MPKLKIIKNIIILFLVVVITGYTTGCKKNQLGGKASVSGVVAHHGKPIADAYIYIKYNTTEFPGEDYSKYDTYIKADASGNYTIAFYKGNYYLYAKGYDMDIPSPYVVSGGLSVSVRNKEKLSKSIAVSE